MIPQQTLERLQAGAIVRPGDAVPCRCGRVTIHVRPLNEFDLQRARVSLVSMETSSDDDTPSDQLKIADRNRAVINSVFSDIAASADGLEDIDGDLIAIDIAAEPGGVLTYMETLEAVQDCMTISTMTASLSGNSASPLPSSERAGAASMTAAATAGAIPAESKGKTTGRKRKRPRANG